MEPETNLWGMGLLDGPKDLKHRSEVPAVPKIIVQVRGQRDMVDSLK